MVGAGYVGHMKCIELNGNPAFTAGELELPCSEHTCPGYSGCEICCALRVSTVNPLIKDDWFGRGPRINETHGIIADELMAPSSMLVIILPVCLIAVFLVFVGVALFYWIRKRQQTQSSRNITETEEGVRLQISLERTPADSEQDAHTPADSEQDAHTPFSLEVSLYQPLDGVPPEDQQDVSFNATSENGMESKAADQCAHSSVFKPGSLKNDLPYVF